MQDTAALIPNSLGSNVSPTRVCHQAFGVCREASVYKNAQLCLSQRGAELESLILGAAAGLNTQEGFTGLAPPSTSLLF